MLAVNVLAGIPAAGYVLAQNAVNFAVLAKLTPRELRARPWHPHVVLERARLRVPPDDSLLLVVGSESLSPPLVADALYPRHVHWLRVPDALPSDEELKREAASRDAQWVVVDGRSGIGSVPAEDRIWKLSE